MTSSKEELKIMIMREGLTVKKLADMLAQKTNKHYTQISLQHKIYLSSLKYDEMLAIADMLGYDIKIEKRKRA